MPRTSCLFLSNKEAFGCKFAVRSSVKMLQVEKVELHLTLRLLQADFLYVIFFLELVSLSPSAMQAPLPPLA